MDSDGLPLQSMDHLFTIKMPTGVRIAAPQGYWFENQGFVSPDRECHGEGPRIRKENFEIMTILFPTVDHGIEDYVAITSALLVIDPGQDLFDRVSPYFGKYMEWRNHEVLLKA